MFGELIQSNTKKSLLFISGNSESGELLDTLFKMSDYETLWRNDSTSGLNQALISLPDFIVVDLDLPDGGAFDLVRSLRHFLEFKHKPVVAMCGDAGEEFHQVVLDAGFSRYFCKPVKFELMDMYLKSFG